MGGKSGGEGPGKGRVCGGILYGNGDWETAGFAGGEEVVFDGGGAGSETGDGEVGRVEENADGGEYGVEWWGRGCWGETRVTETSWWGWEWE